jgi:hypothetical protein
MLMAFVTAIEFLNNRFDPFELKLDGWSENVHESIGEYDDVFEELHEKYKSTGKVSPEIKLLLTLGGSAFMFHLTNNIFKSAMPQFESAIGSNPDILNNMMNKKNQNNNPMSSNTPNMGMGNMGMGNMGMGGGGGLDIGGLLGMMSNMSQNSQMGGLGNMDNMSAFADNVNGNIDNMDVPLKNNEENVIKKKSKSMEGPQGLDTLLDSLSTNNKTVNTTKRKKKKGMNL